ncbi:MAG TPA: hypothetical protein VGK00_06910 [Anaerolineales bacterium]|jgi:hypothetical protein
MGRQAANKRKPKANSWPVSKTGRSGNLNEIVKDKGAPLNNAVGNAVSKPATGSNKAHKKGN